MLYMYGKKWWCWWSNVYAEMCVCVSVCVLWLSIRIRSTTLSARCVDHIDETLLVLNTTASTTALFALLLLLFDLRSLTLDFTGTSQRTVLFTAEQTQTHVNLAALFQSAQRFLVQHTTLSVENQVLFVHIFGFGDESLDREREMKWENDNKTQGRRSMMKVIQADRMSTGSDDEQKITKEEEEKNVYRDRWLTLMSSTRLLAWSSNTCVWLALTKMFILKFGRSFKEHKLIKLIDNQSTSTIEGRKSAKSRDRRMRLLWRKCASEAGGNECAACAVFFGFVSRISSRFLSAKFKFQKL